MHLNRFMSVGVAVGENDAGRDRGAAPALFFKTRMPTAQGGTGAARSLAALDLVKDVWRRCGRPMRR